MPEILESFWLKRSEDTKLGAETRLYSVSLAGGWSVVLGFRADFRFRIVDLAVDLSEQGEVLLYYGDPSAGVSAIHAYSRRRSPWGFRYSRDGGVVVDGMPPVEVPDALSKAIAEQEDAGGMSVSVDYVYQVAADIGESLVGFRPADSHEGLVKLEHDEERHEQAWWNKRRRWWWPF